MHNSLISFSSQLLRTSAALVLASVVFCQASLAQNPKPVRALLIVGGCCHDYDSQKEIIKRGLEQSAYIDVTVVHQGGTGTKAEIELYRNPKWADDFDVILHDECFSDDKDPQWLARILEPHRKGKPGVVIHCAMHCYRVGNDDWFEFCGVTSRGHGPHYPHEVRNVLATHPIMEGFGAAWANPAGELYRIDRVWPTTTPLGTAKDRENGQDQVCVWTNDFRGTRVFGTTLGHHNETVEAPEFIQMLTRGTLWAANKLSPEYLKPKPKRFERENLAIGSKATASSEQKDQNNLIPFAVDGNRATRWCASNGSYPQWIQIDLGASKEVHGIGIDWESDQAKYRYAVEGSLDGENFQELGKSAAEGNPGKAAEHMIDPTQLRYVRIRCIGASPGAWASIRELKVYGAKTKEISLEDNQRKREMELLGECKIPAGFEATLFAHPPAVNYPVFVAAAPDGTLFVSSDKNGSLDRELKRGSIVRLKDLDGDGRADQSNLYVDNVDSPRGLVWDHDRLYVLHPPHLSAFIDENGDGVSDRQEILVKDIAFGFKDRPADHTSNGVTMGIDGWLYLAIGDFGFMNAVGADGRKLQFRGGGVVRVRPDGSGLEIYSQGTRNILEVAMDPLLRGFARDNTNDGGGWDVRMHHFTGSDDHGYPRKYIHFPNEIIAPLADYGGGSGCGALFLDEPGWPADLTDCIYTADWGRQQIFSHRIQTSGATVKVDQKEFLGIERATDLDVDGLSKVYAASWKGATFNYAGENVGFIVQLQPKGYKPSPLPGLDSSKDVSTPGPWLELIQSSSHRRRIEGQRGLVRLASLLPDRAEALAKELYSLAENEATPLKSRIAALFGIAIIRDQWIRGGQDKQVASRILGLLTGLANRPTIAPWAIRALGDAQTWETHEATDVFKRGLQSEESRTLLETLVALDKLGTNARSKTEGTTQVRSQDESSDWSVRIAPHLSSPDATIRHLATRAIARLGAIDKCIAICSEQSETSLAFEHAVQALSLIHDPERVNQLINALDRVPAQVRTQKESSFGNAMARALARLYMHEGEWTGTSWGTRPDTRGPYYQPEKWDASAAIEEAMNRWLKKQDGGSATETLRLLSLNRWDISSKIGDWIRSPQWNEIPFQQRITLIESAGNLSDDALGLLDRVAEDPRLSEEDLLGLFKVSLQQSSPSSLSVVRKVLKRIGSLSTEALATAWKRCHESDRLAKQLSVLSESASKDTDLGSAILVSAVASRKDQAKRAESTDAIDRWWGSTSVVVELLNMLRVGKCKQAEGIVQRAMLDNRSEVEKLGREIATEWGLGDLNQWTGPKISTLDKSEVLKQVVGTKGDVKRGEQAFGLLGCAKCHDVKPSESLRGPYLPNVAKTYRRDQLTEAILMPSKSIAQGFVQNVFRLDDDSVVSGFVTKESAQKILIRNAQGEVVEIEVESITERKESPLSVMPEGLVDGVPVPALVDLVSYLESLN